MAAPILKRWDASMVAAMAIYGIMSQPGCGAQARAGYASGHGVLALAMGVGEREWDGAVSFRWGEWGVG